MSRDSRRRAAAGAGGPGPPAAEGPGCEVTAIFTVFGQPHMLRILHLFRDGRPRRFTEIERRLALSPKTLSQRLRVLVDCGFLERRSFRELPPRVEYGPTAKTDELDQLFEALARWSRRHSLSQVPSVAVVGRVRS